MPDFMFPVVNFNAGLQTYPTYRQMDDNALRYAKNCVYDQNGILKRRPGLEKITTPDGYFGYCRELLVAGDGAERRLYVVYKDTGPTGTSNNTRYRNWDGDSWGADSATWSGLSQFRLQSAWVRESDGSEYIYHYNSFRCGVNNGDPVYENLTVNVPDTSNYILFRDRLWGFRSNNWGIIAGDRIYYSNLLEPEVFDARQTISVPAFGQNLTGLAPFRDNLLFVGATSICYLLAVGTSPNLLDWDLRQITTDIGVGGQYSIAANNSDLFFIDQRGSVRALTDIGSIQSARIEPVSVSLPIRDKVVEIYENFGLINLSAVLYDDKYLLFGATVDRDSFTTTSGKNYAFDARMNAWTGPIEFLQTAAEQDGGANVTAATTVIGPLDDDTDIGDSEEYVYMGAGTNNTDSFEIYKLRASLDDDDSNLIEVDIQTKPYDFGFPTQEKEMRWVEVEYGEEATGFSAAGTMRVFGQKDFSGEWLHLADLSYDSLSRVERVKVPMRSLGRGRVFQIRILDRNESDGPKLRAMMFSGHAYETRDN